MIPREMGVIPGRARLGVFHDNVRSFPIRDMRLAINESQNRAIIINGNEVTIRSPREASGFGRLFRDLVSLRSRKTWTVDVGRRCETRQSIAKLVSERWLAIRFGVATRTFASIVESLHL